MGGGNLAQGERERVAEMHLQLPLQLSVVRHRLGGFYDGYVISARREIVAEDLPCVIKTSISMLRQRHVTDGLISLGFAAVHVNFPALYRVA